MFVADARVFDGDAGLSTSTSESHQYPVPARLSICQVDVPASHAKLIDVFGLRRDGASLLRRTGRHLGERVLLQNGDPSKSGRLDGERSVDDARIDEVCGRASRGAQRQLRLVVYLPGRAHGRGGGAIVQEFGVGFPPCVAQAHSRLLA